MASTAASTTIASVGLDSSDTYLIIKPPTGNQIDNDDRNQAAGTDAGYDLDVTQTGTWQVLVTSFRPGEVGAYTLTVQQVR